MKNFWYKLPLAYKLFATWAALSVLLLGTGNAVLYRIAKESLRNELRDKIESVARTGAAQIDPRFHEQLRTKADENSPEYKTLKDQLRVIRDSNPDIRYVYTMRKLDNKNKWEFVVDAESDQELVSHIGDTYDASGAPDMRDSYAKTTSDKRLTNDKWGTWLSAYSPIVNRDGKTVGILAVDMSAKQLAAQESALKTSEIRIVLLALLFAAIISIFFTAALIKPVRVFTDAAQRIRSGDLDFDVQIDSSPEINQLARAFNDMIHGLKQNSKDGLTGLYNHKYFHNSLMNELHRSERFGRDLTLLILDLDRFKSINDTLGHLVGDSLLKQLSDVLSVQVRKVDLVCRYGGDEFSVILPESDVSIGMMVAERIRSAVESHKFFAVPVDELNSRRPDDGRIVHLTVTLGMSCYPADHVTKDGLVMAADLALARAKRLGRNRVCQYDVETDGASVSDTSELYGLLEPNREVNSSVSMAVDPKEQYMLGHVERVTNYALWIAESMGLDKDMQHAVMAAGLLHDIGKVQVSNAVLYKRSGLTQLEQDILRAHPGEGAAILSKIDTMDNIIAAVAEHHERWDGAGYPNHLSGEQISLMARILAVADAFDAMTSDRPYRKAMSPNAALLEIRANAGKQFDPDIVAHFISLVSSKPDNKAA